MPEAFNDLTADVFFVSREWTEDVQVQANLSGVRLPIFPEQDIAFRRRYADAFVVTGRTTLLFQIGFYNQDVVRRYLKFQVFHFLFLSKWSSC